MITSEKQNTPKTEKKRNYSTDSVPYKRIISNLEGNFERFHKYSLIPSLLKFFRPAHSSNCSKYTDGYFQISFVLIVDAKTYVVDLKKNMVSRCSISSPWV
jgi:hypothetical protein